jgi:hypothetical protein
MIDTKELRQLALDGDLFAVETALDELDALRVALREIAWSNDSKWQADRARDVLGEQK